jgi:hypothetical protein
LARFVGRSSATQSIRWRMNRIFKPPVSMTGAISQDQEELSIAFLLDEKPNLGPGS